MEDAKEDKGVEMGVDGVNSEIGIDKIDEDENDSDVSVILPSQPEVNESYHKSKLKRLSDKLKLRKTLQVSEVKSDPLGDAKSEESFPGIEKNSSQNFTFKFPKPDIVKIKANSSVFSLPKQYIGLKLEHIRTQIVLNGYSQIEKSQRRSSSQRSLLPSSFQDLDTDSPCDVVPSSQVPVTQDRKRKRRGNGWSSNQKKLKNYESEIPAKDYDSIFQPSEDLFETHNFESTSDNVSDEKTEPELRKETTSDALSIPKVVKFFNKLSKEVELNERSSTDATRETFEVELSSSQAGKSKMAKENKTCQAEDPCNESPLKQGEIVFRDQCYKTSFP